MLRIIGAVSVVFYHYTYRGIFSDGTRIPIFPLYEIVTKYGYLGVNLFFMISGFVILFSVLNKSPIHFAISRMDRLYPAYWVAVTLTASSVIILTDTHISLKQYLMNLTMINNYFNIQSIEGLYWTLHVELKFYFLIFLLMLTKQIKHYHIWIPIWLTITLSHLFFSQPFFMGWIISPHYSSYFIAGILFYLIYRDGVNWQRISALLVSMCISIYLSINQINGFIANPALYDRIVAPTVVIFIHLIFFMISTRIITVKGSRVLLMAGGLTYPVYLLHARIGKTLFDLTSPYMNKHLVLIGIMIFIISISYAIYTIVERKTSGKLARLLLSFLPIRAK